MKSYQDLKGRTKKFANELLAITVASIKTSKLKQSRTS
jgi:hypothetical protein